VERAPVVAEDAPPVDLLFVQPQPEGPEAMAERGFPTVIDMATVLAGIGGSAGGAGNVRGLATAWFDTFATTQYFDTGAAVVSAPFRENARSFARLAENGPLPFRLLAIVNRTDLATDACAESGAEARFVYTLTGPLSGEPKPFTVIFEYALHGSTQRWVERFRALRRAESGALLAQLARDVALEERGLATLRRVRTNEATFGRLRGDWELREYTPMATPDGPRLRVSPLAGSPAISFDGSTELADWVASNGDAIARGENPVPPEMQTLTLGFPRARFRWLAGGDPKLSQQFSRNTCNGCHGGDRPEESMDFQIVAPVPPPVVAYYGPDNGRDGGAPKPRPPLTSHGVQVSRYLLDPDHRHDDELARRGRIQEEILEVRCNVDGGHRLPGRRFAH
jgi:hypothetical protein